MTPRRKALVIFLVGFAISGAAIWLYAAKSAEAAEHRARVRATGHTIDATLEHRYGHGRHGAPTDDVYAVYIWQYQLHQVRVDCRDDACGGPVTALIDPADPDYVLVDGVATNIDTGSGFIMAAIAVPCVAAYQLIKALWQLIPPHVRDVEVPQ